MKIIQSCKFDGGAMISDLPCDLAGTVMPSLTDEEFARWRRDQNIKIVIHNNQYWEEKPAGFYHPVHWLARVGIDQVSRPALLCWGYRATLREEDAAHANSSMPIHLLADVARYDLQWIGSNRRNKIKNCMKRVEIIDLVSPSLLLEQGYRVMASAQQRCRHIGLMSPRQYHAYINNHFNPRRGLILAGLIDGRLGGYVIAFAVKSTVYIHDVCIATDALPSNIGTGLVFALIQACRRSGKIEQAVYGLHTPEDQNLCHYKKEMGFHVAHIPARVWFMPPTDRYIRSVRPHAYYRLTGETA